MERIKSGILGLDKLIEGGFEKGTVVEIAGSEGSFKSIFALQFAVEGIKNNEKVTYISLEEPKESFLENAKAFGWDKDFSKINFNFLNVNDAIKKMKKSAISSTGLEGFAREVLKGIGKADRLVLDTATTLALYSSRTRVKLKGSQNWEYLKPSSGDIRVMLYYIASELRKNKKCTSLFLAEAGEGELYLPEEVLKYICDAKIELKKSSLGTRVPRSIQISKMRHTNHTLEEMPLSLTKTGLKIEKIGP